MKDSETLPGLEKDFQKGIVLIKRIGKTFSRQPIDLTLEQTIKADLTNFVSARQECARSHHMCSTIITDVREDL